MRLLLFLIVLLAGNQSIAREARVYLTFKVTDEYTEHQIDSSFVTIYHADTIFKTDTAFFFGLDVFYLPTNMEFEFEVGKNGYVSKKGAINTRADHIDDVPYRIDMTCFVGLFPACHEHQYDFLANTDLISFNLNEHGAQNWDREQTKKMQDRIYEAHFSHLNEPLKSKVNKAFSEVIALLEDKKFETADSLFLKKKEVLMHDEVYCGIVSHLHGVVRKTIQINEEERQYKKLKDAADKAFEERSFEKAEELYSRMHQLRPNDWYPEDRLYDIEYEREKEDKQ